MLTLRARRSPRADLGLAQWKGQPVAEADPYNGARRASDENNTRRTTLMEVALAFNALALGDATVRGATHAGDAACAAAATRRGALGLLERGVSWSDRAALVAAHADVARANNRLDDALLDMAAVCASHRRAPDVRQTLRQLAAHASPRGEFELPTPDDG